MNDILEIIRFLVSEQRELNVRGFKGMGTSHAFTERTPTNLGTSSIERHTSIKDKKTNSKKNPVKVSKAFSNTH